LTLAPFDFLLSHSAQDLQSLKRSRFDFWREQEFTRASAIPQSTLAWMIAFGVALMSLTNFTFVGFLSLQRDRLS
jgi:hypothetical protein